MIQISILCTYDLWQLWPMAYQRRLALSFFENIVSIDTQDHHLVQLRKKKKEHHECEQNTTQQLQSPLVQTQVLDQIKTFTNTHRTFRLDNAEPRPRSVFFSWTLQTSWFIILCMTPANLHQTFVLTDFSIYCRKQPDMSDKSAFISALQTGPGRPSASIKMKITRAQVRGQEQ